MWYLGGAVGRVAGNATAFGERNMRYMLSIDSIWKDPADDERNLSWSRAFWGDMKDHSGGRAYLNFAGLGEEGEDLVRNSYGAANYSAPRRLEDQIRSNKPVSAEPQNIKPSA